MVCCVILVLSLADRVLGTIDLVVEVVIVVLVVVSILAVFILITGSTKILRNEAVPEVVVLVEGEEVLVRTALLVCLRLRHLLLVYLHLLDFSTTQQLVQMQQQLQQGTMKRERNLPAPAGVVGPAGKQAMLVLKVLFKDPLLQHLPHLLLEYHPQVVVVPRRQLHLPLVLVVLLLGKKPENLLDPLLA